MTEKPGKAHRNTKGVRLTPFHVYEVCVRDSVSGSLVYKEAASDHVSAVTAANRIGFEMSRSSRGRGRRIEVFDPVLGQEISMNALCFLTLALAKANLTRFFK